MKIFQENTILIINLLDNYDRMFAIFSVYYALIVLTSFCPKFHNGSQRSFN